MHSVQGLGKFSLCEILKNDEECSSAKSSETRERGGESGSARGRTERDFCTIDLHPMDKLENASPQSEKMKSYYETESMHVKYLRRYANILFFLSTNEQVI